MMLLMLSFLADVVPNVGASSNGLPGIPALNQFLSWLIYAAVFICAGSAVWSGALLAYGHQSSRPDLAVKGKTGLLWAMGGAVAIALAIPLVNAAYGAAGQ